MTRAEYGKLRLRLDLERIITLADVTQLLLRWNSGDDIARGELMEALYAELRIIAARHLASERSGDLQPSALVNEAYLRLIDLNRIDWQNRAHFLSMSAKVMRDILVDEARKRYAAKRDGGIQVTLSGISSKDIDSTTDTLTLHNLLERLAGIDPDRARLVELRYFGGLTIDETAEVLETSPATVKRSWKVARGWLYKEINRGKTNAPN